jgi:hypothetical protein
MRCNPDHASIQISIGPQHHNRSISHLLMSISQSCNRNTNLPILLGNRILTVWMGSLAEVGFLLWTLLLNLRVRAFDTIKHLSTGAIYVGEIACSIFAATAILVIEVFAERLQAAVDQRAASWGGKRVGADTEILCWQLYDDFLDGFVNGIDACVDECVCLVGGCSLLVGCL